MYNNNNKNILLIGFSLLIVILTIDTGRYNYSGFNVTKST